MGYLRTQRRKSAAGLAFYHRRRLLRDAAYRARHEGQPNPRYRPFGHVQRNIITRDLEPLAHPVPNHVRRMQLRKVRG